jgi:hypothetical protein
VLDLAEELRSLVAALEASGIDHAVCGGLAVAIHAQPRATMDIDLLVRSEALDAIKRVVRGLAYTIEAGLLRIRPGAIEIHRMTKPDPDSGDVLSIGLLLVTSELEPFWAGREQVSWEYGVLPVASGCSRRAAMVRAEMTPKAVTVRRIRTSQLRRLCLLLGGGSAGRRKGRARR